MTFSTSFHGLTSSYLHLWPVVKTNWGRYLITVCWEQTGLIATSGNCLRCWFGGKKKKSFCCKFVRFLGVKSLRGETVLKDSVYGKSFGTKLFYHLKQRNFLSWVDLHGYHCTNEHFTHMVGNMWLTGLILFSWMVIRQMDWQMANGHSTIVLT